MKGKTAIIHIIVDLCCQSEYYIRYIYGSLYRNDDEMVFKYLYRKNGKFYVKLISILKKNIVSTAEVDPVVIDPMILRRIMEFGYVYNNLAGSGQRTHIKETSSEQLSKPSSIETRVNVQDDKLNNESELDQEKARAMLEDFRHRAAAALGGA